MHVHDLMPFHTTKFDMSHSVNKLSFGDDFPGVVNPLDAISRNMPGKGLSHAPRPACAIAHTRPAKGALRPEGRIPSDCYHDCLLIPIPHTRGPRH